MDRPASKLLDGKTDMPVPSWLCGNSVITLSRGQVTPEYLEATTIPCRPFVNWWSQTASEQVIQNNNQQRQPYELMR